MVTFSDQAVVDRASDDMLTKPELANRLRKSVRTIDSWMNAGPRIPYIKIGGKTVLFVWPDVVAKLSTFRVN